MAESKEEQKSLLMKVKEESEKAGLTLKGQKTKSMASGLLNSWQIDGATMEIVTDFIFFSSKITADVDCSYEIKRCLLLGRKAMSNQTSVHDYWKNHSFDYIDLFYLFIYFIFISPGGASKKTLLWFMSKSVFPMFSSKSFIVSGLTFVVVAVVQSLSHVWLFVTPWTAASQASLSFTISWSLLMLMSTESVIPSNHLTLCCPLLLLSSIFPIIRIFSSESSLPIRWPKYWSFSFSISPFNEYSGLISFRIDWFDLLEV